MPDRRRTSRDRDRKSPRRRSHSRSRGRRRDRSRSRSRDRAGILGGDEVGGQRSRSRGGGGGRRRTASRGREGSKKRRNDRENRERGGDRDRGERERDAEAAAARRRRSGWDDANGNGPTGGAAVAAAAAPAVAPTPGIRIQSFEELLEQVRNESKGGCGGPGQEPLRPAAAAAPHSATPLGPGLPMRPLEGLAGAPVNAEHMVPREHLIRGEVFQVATPEVLQAARERAKQFELVGREALQKTGQVPRGPPALPNGAMVVEQKYVSYLIGAGGLGLAAINSTAGVHVQIDHTNMHSGYSIVQFWGTEEQVQQAKFLVEFKISQYRPRQGVAKEDAHTLGSIAPQAGAGAVVPAGALPPRTVAGDPLPPPEASDNALARSLARWPSLARSAAQAAADRQTAAAAAQVPVAATAGGSRIASL